jgi:predicted Zn-dependent protease
MKNINFIIGVLLTFLLATGGCSRKIIPGIRNEAGKNFDEATFNYVYAEALRQKLMGNNGEALKYFEQCIIMNQASDASYFQMAQIVLGNNDPANARKYLRKASEIQPANIWYQIMLAGTYFQQKMLDSATYHYETAVKIDPERRDLQLALANLYTETGKSSKAREILKKLDEKYGLNENTTISLIKNLIRDKKFEEAKSKVNELLLQDPDQIVYNGLLAEIYQNDGKSEEALAVYSHLLERNPDDPVIQMKLCDFLLKEKEYDELFAVINTLILNSKISKEEKIAFFGGMIEDTIIIKNYFENMKMALLILEATYVNDDIVLLLRPEFLNNQKKAAEASNRLEELVRLKPDNYPAWEKLLIIYYEAGNYEKLQVTGKEAATRFNRSILAKILYAHAAMENKDYVTALDELKKAEILAGDNEEIQLQVITMKADIYYRSGNYDNAFKCFEEALSKKGDDITVLNNYAYYLAEQNMKLKEAEVMAKTVISREKDNTTFLDTYAWVLYKRGKAREAARIMEQIVNSGEKDDAEWYEHYGYILKKLGKCREAVEKWEKAIALDGSKNNLKDEIERCKKLQ